MNLKNSSRCLALAVTALSIALLPARAEAGNRSLHKFGFHLGLITEPVPSIYGVNVGYNVAEFVRLGVGLGFIKLSDATMSLDATTFAGEAKFMVPDWGLSPYASIGYANVSVTLTGNGDLSALGGLSGSGGAGFYGFGLDWQTSGGFNIGFSMKRMMISDPTGNGVSFLPGFYMGWYF